MLRVGMLTSGGDCQALNAAMRGVAKSLFNQCSEVEIYGFTDGYKGLIYGEYRLLKNDDFSGILNIGGTILGSSRMPFKYIGVPLEDGSDKIARMIDTYKKLNLDCLVVLGGNGSHKTANLLREKGLNVLTLPKTIDNDLPLTDCCPGFGSVAKYIAVSTIEASFDVRSMCRTSTRVFVLEVMGRHAGWLTAAAALAEGKNGNVPYLVYLEEKPFSLDRFIDDVKEKLASTNAVLVAVSEGVHDTEGRFLCEQEESRELDVFGHTKLSGTGKILEEAVRAKIGCKVRSIELNVMQRCASHMASKTDVDESVKIGEEAVKAAVKGETGKMMAFKRISDRPYFSEIVTVDAKEVANKERLFPKEWINNQGNNVTAFALDYFLPLIQGESAPPFANGTPRYAKLKRIKPEPKLCK